MLWILGGTWPYPMFTVYNYPVNMHLFQMETFLTKHIKYCSCVHYTSKKLKLQTFKVVEEVILLMINAVFKKYLADFVYVDIHVFCLTSSEA